MITIFLSFRLTGNTCSRIFLKIPYSSSSLRTSPNFQESEHHLKNYCWSLSRSANFGIKINCYLETGCICLWFSRCHDCCICIALLILIRSVKQSWIPYLVLNMSQKYHRGPSEYVPENPRQILKMFSKYPSGPFEYVPGTSSGRTRGSF